jgi:hypothetical protein
MQLQPFRSEIPDSQLWCSAVTELCAAAVVFKDGRSTPIGCLVGLSYHPNRVHIVGSGRAHQTCLYCIPRIILLPKQLT